MGPQDTSKGTKRLWRGWRQARRVSHGHLHPGSGSTPVPAEATMSGISLELSPGQMQIAALLTPSPCNLLYLAVPPHAVGIDQPAGSISRFLLWYLSAPSISHSAPLSAVPVYTFTIYLCRLICSHQQPFGEFLSSWEHHQTPLVQNAEQQGKGDTVHLACPEESLTYFMTHVQNPRAAVITVEVLERN